MIHKRRLTQYCVDANSGLRVKKSYCLVARLLCVVFRKNGIIPTPVSYADSWMNDMMSERGDSMGAGHTVILLIGTLDARIGCELAGRVFLFYGRSPLGRRSVI